MHEVHLIVSDVSASIGWARENCRAKLNYEHADLPGYFWDNIRPKKTGRLTWEIDCTATPFQFQADAENPLERPAVITYDGSLVVEPTNFDSDARPICTTAGEFIAGVERDRPIIAYHVQKNLPADPVWLHSHIGATNADAVKLRGRICPPRTLKLVNPSGGPFTTENRVRFFSMTFDLLFDPLGHRVERWNLGTLQLVEKLNKKGKKTYVQEVIRTGSPPKPVDEPVPIDIRGKVIENFLTPSDDGRPFDVTKLVKRSWDVQRVLPFGGVLPLV